MRNFVLAGILAFCLSGAAHAASFDDPKALVTALYQPYLDHEKPADPAIYYSDGLKALFAKHQQSSEITGVGMPPKSAPPEPDDFDPFVNAKHYLMLDFVVGEPVISGDHALVDVSYKNFDHPTVLSLSLVKAADGWKIDDVASLGGDQHWLLSWLLAYDPLGVQ
jgi:hypothetical protein